MAGFKIVGEVDRIRRIFNGSENPARLTDTGSIAMAQVEVPGTEMLRGGYRFIGGTQNGATGAAQNTAIPTTTAAAVLANGETIGPNAKSYVVDFLSWFPFGGTAATTAGQLWATVAKLATPTAQASWTSQSASAGSRATKAVWALAQTIPTSSWITVTGSPFNLTVNLQNTGNTTFPGGMFLIPPGYVLGLTVVSQAGTSPTYGISASWIELELDIE